MIDAKLFPHTAKAAKEISKWLSPITFNGRCFRDCPQLIKSSVTKTAGFCKVMAGICYEGEVCPPHKNGIDIFTYEPREIGGSK